jgi:hypothetical protein
MQVRTTSLQLKEKYMSVSISLYYFFLKIKMYSALNYKRFYFLNDENGHSQKKNMMRMIDLFEI